MGTLRIYRVALIVLLLVGCTTTYYELKGECVSQNWTLGGFSMRKRMICDLPPPEVGEIQVKDREAMDVNPFPDLIDRVNPADSTDPNLLEKEMGYPQVDE